MGNPKVEDILKIIDKVKTKEREKGISDEEIVFKYTYGSCVELACLIKQQFLHDKDVWLMCITRTFYKCKQGAEKNHYMSGSAWHVCIGLGMLEEGNRPTRDCLIFDINGKRRFEEMEEYLDYIYNKEGNHSERKDETGLLNFLNYQEVLRRGCSAIQDCYADFLKAKRNAEESGEM